MSGLNNAITDILNQTPRQLIENIQMNAVTNSANIILRNFKREDVKFMEKQQQLLLNGKSMYERSRNSRMKNKLQAKIQAKLF